jgi:hypothetical protein
MAEKVRVLTKPTERANLDISFFIGMALTPIEKNGNTSDYRISEVDCMVFFGIAHFAGEHCNPWISMSFR